MPTTYGRIQEFQPDTESNSTYLQRVELYFTANGIEDAKKVPVLLSSIGVSTYALLSDLLAPTVPGTATFAVLSDTLTAHFEPQRSTITERFHFHKREQVAGEAIAAYDAALRKLAVHCKFGTVLQDTLRDRFVCRLRHDTIQRRLLSETALTYVKALEIAKGMEAADIDAKAFQKTDLAVKKLGDGRPHIYPSTKKQPCYRCGRSNHNAAEYRFKDAQCHSCEKTGHISSVCSEDTKETQS